jgi:transposase
VARRHDILPQQIRRWRRQLFGEIPTISEAPIFAPVTLIDAAPPAQPGGRSSKPRPVMVEISLRNGRVLKVAADLERQVLASLIACVEAA